jgi:hypothetical protein
MNEKMISPGMIHPGLLAALMLAAKPKQIAMARRTVNNERHIMASSSHDHSF